MLINLVGTFRYECAIEKYYSHAIRELGHRLVIVTPDGIDMLSKADLTIVVKWCSMPELLPHPRVLIFTDLTTRFKKYYDDVQKHYDYVFLVHNEPLVDQKRVHYLPVAFDSKEHYSLDRKKTIDILFVGTYRFERDFIRNIPNIKIYGNGWNPKIGDIYGDDLRELYARTKTALNYRYIGDTTNMRQYEILAQKVFLLSDHEGEFKDGRDLVVYKDKEDLEQKIKYYLNHEEERIKIAEQGYLTVTTGKYTYKDRMEELLKICKRGET